MGQFCRQAFSYASISASSMTSRWGVMKRLLPDYISKIGPNFDSGDEAIGKYLS